jgi:prepilin-type N-terminal cleavage/methylation domain-containing protein
MKYSRKYLPGFTLIEVAIVLVIIGLLVGMGAGLIGPLTKRAKLHESRDTVKEVFNVIVGYTVANKTLPADLTVLSTKTKDAYGKDVLYYAAGAITAADLCTTQGSYLTVVDSGATKSNVAFVVFSQGENMCNQTGLGSPFTISGAGDPVACAGSGATAGYDDIVQYQDINFLREQICNSFRITTDSLPVGTEEIAYPSTTLQATDGTTPFMWSVNGQVQGTYGCGALDYPISTANTGLCLTTGGSITPATVPSSVPPILDGSFNFSVTVTDSEGRTATKSLTITINPNDPRINTEVLHSGTVGSAYSAAIAASGGSGTYTWTMGTLPAGLSQAGSTNAITGTPTADGTTSFTVQITDARGRTATKSLSIAISDTSGSGGSSSGGSGGGGGGGGGSPVSCSLSASSGIVQYGETADLTFSVTNGPAYASFSPSGGTCTTFAITNGDSCTTGTLSSTVTIVLSVNSASGSNSCSTTIYVGRNEYRVWNNTGSRRDFIIDGSCRRVSSNREITTTSLRLNAGEAVYRYATNNRSCGGGIQDQMDYNTAVYADSDNDGRVNFSGTDR